MNNLFVLMEVGDGSMKVVLLQFTDDILIFGVTLVGNVLTLKSILRYFEIMAGDESQLFQE